MKCEEVVELLSPYLDNELEQATHSAVEQHLSTCEACAAELASLKEVDSHFSRLAVPVGLADHIHASMNEAAATQETSKASEESLRPQHWRGWAIAFAVAASLLAVVAWSIKDDEVDIEAQTPVAVVESPIAATLVAATGEIEVKGPDEPSWQLIEEVAGATVAEGRRVRTSADALCELTTSRQCTIRMDRDAELILHEEDRIELTKGKIWCKTPSDQSLKIDTPAGAIGADEPSWAMTCPTASEIQVTVGQTKTTTELLASQPTQWQLGSDSCQIEPGETVVIGPDEQIHRSSFPLTGAKAWQLPLIALEHAQQSELSAVLKPILAPIGRTKATRMHEEQIRTLGAPGAIPLLAFVLSDESKQDAHSRRTAARLASENCDHSALTLLDRLKDDEDAAVAADIRKAIARLTD